MEVRCSCSRPVPLVATLPVRVCRLRAVRRDQLHRGEVGAVAWGVAGESAHAGDRGMGADVEVGQRASAAPAAPPVPHRTPCRRGRRPPTAAGPARRARPRQLLVERLDACEADGDLREHDVIDHEAALRRAAHDALRRPLVPAASGSNTSSSTLLSTRTRTRSVSPRVRAMISSVVILMSAEPRARSSQVRRLVILPWLCAGRPSVSLDDELDLRVRQQSWCSRMACGMVTCPLPVMRIVRLLG